ncbi:hypothetical protein [Sorangium sp. So ce131]|uniref:hypothetical protein n=1 Tax=Sorangium sp. So ce131 TaxID=3133282 RepID=UPI003F616552
MHWTSFHGAGALALLASMPLALGACIGDPGEHAPAASEELGTTATSFEEFEAGVYREPDTGVYIVDGDMPIATREQLEDFYLAHVQQGALIVQSAGLADDRWSDAQKRNITYCVSTSFGGYYAAVVVAMANATAAWEAAADVNFTHLSAHDWACAANNPAVVFDVSPTVWQPYLARAFLPSYPRAYRSMLVDAGAFGPIAPYTLSGVLRHELGHTLGFRHEHTRPESGAWPCFEDGSWRALTSYDAASVMHYWQCNGTNVGDLVLTQRDKDGAKLVYGAPPL